MPTSVVPRRIQLIQRAEGAAHFLQILDHPRQHIHRFLIGFVEEENVGCGFLAEAVRRGGQKAVLQVFLHGGAGGAELVLAVVVQRIPVVSTVSLVADGLLQGVPQSAGRQRSAGEAVQPLARNLAEYLFRGFFPLGQIRQGVLTGGVQIGVIVIAGMTSHGVSLLPHAAGDLGIFLHVFAHHKEGGLDIVFLQYIQNLFGVVGIGFSSNFLFLISYYKFFK